VDRSTNRHALRTRLLAVAALTLFTACSPPSPSTGVPVNITLRDFRITSSTPRVGRGDVTLKVSNNAPSTHEFVVVRTTLPSGQLPIGADGLSVDEDKLQPVEEISNLDAGTTGTLSLHLAPGRYVFFCNLEGHYLGGMHGAIEVTSDA
jgi:uncharacterized cupredoxin-like copper-binding protein